VFVLVIYVVGYPAATFWHVHRIIRIYDKSEHRKQRWHHFVTAVSTAEYPAAAGGSGQPP
jgi:predicted membrane channel-forming protein YqfA (hemolysin III family)